MAALALGFAAPAATIRPIFMPPCCFSSPSPLGPMGTPIPEFTMLGTPFAPPITAAAATFDTAFDPNMLPSQDMDLFIHKR